MLGGRFYEDCTVLTEFGDCLYVHDLAAAAESAAWNVHGWWSDAEKSCWSSNRSTRGDHYHLTTRFIY